MKGLGSDLGFYLKKPEMNVFWVLLVLTLVMAIVNFYYLPTMMAILMVGVLVVLTGGVFLSNLKLAKRNFAEKLEKSQLQGMIVSLQDGIIAYSPNFKVQLFNKAAEGIFGVRANELVGQEFKPNKAQDVKSRVLAQVMFPSLAPVVVTRSATGTWPQVVDLSFDDPVLELRVTTAKILNKDGLLMGFVKIVRDRTREMEASRAKSQFVTVAAHQLRTPLNAVMWTFETLMGETKIPAEFKEMIKNGQMASTKLMKTVNDLLDTAKIEEGRFGYKMVEADLLKFIGDILSQKMLVAQSYGIKLYFDKGNQKEIKVKVDLDRLTMVLDNFLDNAIKYNIKNGEVVVKIEKMKDKPFVQVEVSDTGIGIPAEQINNLFTKFFRADNVLKFKTEGTGLGLYIAKNIVRQHGGQVWAESTINRGSTFYFTLPTDLNLVPVKEVFVE